MQAKVRLRVGKLIEENDFVREQFSQKIQAEIAAAQKEIARLSKDTMSVEEAVQRLTALDLELQKCNNTA